jgi:hypothetical protein
MPASLRLEEKPACSSANPKPTPISRAMSKSSHSGIDISDDIGPITNNVNYSYFLKGLKAQRRKNFIWSIPLRLCAFVPLPSLQSGSFAKFAHRANF